MYIHHFPKMYQPFQYWTQQIMEYNKSSPVTQAGKQPTNRTISDKTNLHVPVVLTSKHTRANLYSTSHELSQAMGWRSLGTDMQTEYPYILSLSLDKATCAMKIYSRSVGGQEPYKLLGSVYSPHFKQWLMLHLLVMLLKFHIILTSNSLFNLFTMTYL